MLPAALAVASAVTSSGMLMPPPVMEDFDDNQQGLWWSAQQTNADFGVVETGMRLEANGVASLGDWAQAGYISAGPDGFLLSTTHDFYVTVTAAFWEPPTVDNGGSLAAYMKLSTDAQGQNAVGVSLGQYNNGQGTQQALNWFETQQGQTVQSQHMGTGGSFRALTIAYDVDTDTITFGDSQNQAQVQGLMDNLGEPEGLYLSVGFEGEGFAFVPHTVCFDDLDFVGTTLDNSVLVPEPATLGLLGAGACLLGSRRRRRVD